MPAKKKTAKKAPAVADDDNGDAAEGRCEEENERGERCQKIAAHADSHAFGDEGEE